MNHPYNNVQEIQRQMQQKQQELANLQNLLLQQNASVAPQAAQSNFNLLQSQGDYHVDAAAFTQHQQPNAAPLLNRRATIPRSKSNMGYAAQPTRMMERTSDDSPHPVKRARVMSQQHPRATPMTGMSRSASNRSEKSIPFVVKGPLQPLQTSNNPNPMMDRFYQSQDDPHVLFESSLQRSPTNKRHSGLSPVEENAGFPEVGMNPLDFLAAQDESIPSPAMVPPPQNFLTPYDGRNSQASLINSVCPSMSSGTSAAETMPLTRENSSFDNQSLSGAFGMTRINSAHSQGAADFMSPEVYAVPSGTSPNKSDYLAYVGAGTSLSPQYPQQSPIDEQFLSQGSSMMERSISATSNASTKSSTERRAKEARLQQIQNANRTKICPKPHDAVKSQSASAKKEGKVAVSKGSYTRPKHPKVFCDMCSDHPDGFRGDHELRRHINAKHEGIVKKFVCRDPSTVGMQSGVQAINPLSKCKQCVARKQYGAYYNAAAHLRRTHFKPKTPRGKNKRGDDEEKRGGKGGGDWPPMNELKQWMEEVFVAADDEVAEGEAQEEDEEETQATAQQFEPSMSMDLSLGHMGENMTYDMGFPPSYHMPELAAIDTTQASYLAVSNMPLSSASEAFAFSPFGQNSPMNNGLSHETAFSISSSNTVTPTNYHQDPLVAEGFECYTAY
ncbi:uncharacterized protein CLUP02_00471 [Colletotrichum lupini]|uniref:DUF7896 domain-containing protein n=1 Tax=Colletotrichum lupini TaxID=145971 RepID=A0A9Q8W865_9PEZI|nr:uncharacterized protein CLUP02_00471 [Colletotrichum lupini]KAK1719267.1 key lime pathogenicity protein [Colletotrichum lupini]UQC73824.1 hypothetical protein CLUP02_00471 [Colletotrichum lupini]